jgi:hypothetical protein
MKRSRSWRTIDVNGERYRWRYGRGAIEVRNARQVVLRIASHVLRGNSPAEFEHGQRKRTSDGYVMPAMVRAVIASNIKEASSL